MTISSSGVSSRPSLYSVFKLFFALGLQSFGGGVATFTLIQEHTVRRLGWVSEEEFVQSWAMVQLAPGINLLALIILIGRRVGGMPGALAALAGLMLPSCAVTALIAAGYHRINGNPRATAAINCAVPAIAAMGLASCVTMAKPLLLKPADNSTPTQSDRYQYLLAFFLMIASGAAVVSRHVSIPAVLLACGCVGAISSALTQRRRTRGSSE
jgi:chromate transporter